MVYIGIPPSRDDSQSGRRPQHVVPYYHNIEGDLNNTTDEIMSSYTQTSLPDVSKIFTGFYPFRKNMKTVTFSTLG